MFIKDSDSKKFRRKKIIKKIKHPIFLFFIFGTSLSIYTFFYTLLITRYKPLIRKFISPTQIVQIKDSPVFQYVQSGFKSNLPANYLSSKLTFADKLSIDINFKNFKKLEFKRSQALEKGVLISSDEDYVNADLSYKGETFPIKIRLKGDWVADHLASGKWSYRVKLRKGKTLFGMRKFSLQTPKTRNYIHEWIFHKLLKKEGLPGLRYKFIPLVVNGRSMGVYALEEHFDTILIESNEYKEGPILKLSESDLWKRIEGNQDVKFDFIDEWDKLAFQKTYPEVFQKRKIYKNPVLKDNFEQANYLLKSFMEGKLDTSDVFDIDSLAKFTAIIELSGGGHALKWHNLRFYYNPIIAKLIPVGFDANAGNRHIKLAIKEAKFAKKFLSDEKFNERFVFHLERISNKEYLDNFFNDVEDDYEYNKKLIYKNNPGLLIDTKNYYQNQKLIKSELSGNNNLRVHLQSNDGETVVINVENKSIGNIRLINLVSNEGIKYLPLDSFLVKSIFHDLSNAGDYSFFIKSGLNARKETNLNNFKLTYSLLGSENNNQTSISPFKQLKNNFSAFKYLDNFKYLPFISVDNNTKVITLKKGSWVISEPLKFPKGYLIIAEPGFKLDINNKAFILSYSPINFIGNEKNPIIFSSNSTGGGLAIFNAEKMSKLSNVIFKGLSNPKTNDWSVTGAISFYESPVSIENTIFKDNISEDSLNIIRSNFKLKESKFVNTSSDALDVDFSDGTIEDSFFINSGNDAIDISGSQVIVDNVDILKVGDKAISVGEESELKGDNIKISQAEIAYASKDLSSILIEDSLISDSRLGFVSFIKKPQYGPGLIKIESSKVNNLEKEYLLEENSVLLVNGKKYKSNIKRVEDVLYGTEYGKSSK